MKCKYCNKPIVLVPSAVERANKYGGKPKDYTKLFEYHAACMIKRRNEATVLLMQKITGDTEKTKPA